jgi:hypothetical protein
MSFTDREGGFIGQFVGALPFYDYLSCPVDGGAEISDTIESMTIKLQMNIGMDEAYDTLSTDPGSGGTLIVSTCNSVSSPQQAFG